MQLKVLLVVFTFLTTSGITFADDKSEQDIPYYSKWGFSGHAGTLTINEESARREGIEADAWMIGGHANYDTEYLLTSLGLEFIGYDDNAGFTQETEDSYGNRETSSSSANAFALSAALGPKYQFGPDKDTMIYGQAGALGLFASERSIGNCTDCYSEDIDLKGGLFFKVGFMQNAGPVALGVTYTQYAGSDDLENNINFVISTNY